MSSQPRRAPKSRTRARPSGGSHSSACRSCRAGPVVVRESRVVIAKVALDAHHRGAREIARALRDAGMEVIYTGLHQTPAQIVETVIQEYGAAGGLSILSGANMRLLTR